MKKCRLCGTEFTVEQIRLRKYLKGVNISSGLKAAKRLGKPIGRPVKFPHNKAVMLRKTGMSWSKIAKELGVSKGAVQYALRNKP